MCRASLGMSILKKIILSFLAWYDNFRHTNNDDINIKVERLYWERNIYIDWFIAYWKWRFATFKKINSLKCFLRLIFTECCMEKCSFFTWFNLNGGFKIYSKLRNYWNGKYSLILKHLENYICSSKYWKQWEVLTLLKMSN
jgi:hypothetical protein